jgi:hypothetical protein
MCISQLNTKLVASATTDLTDSDLNPFTALAREIGARLRAERRAERRAANAAKRAARQIAHARKATITARRKPPPLAPPLPPRRQCYQSHRTAASNDGEVTDA